jgi:hypothetical protein
LGEFRTISITFRARQQKFLTKMVSSVLLTIN